MVRADCLRGCRRGSRAKLAKIVFLFSAAGCLAGCVGTEASSPPQAEALIAPPRNDASLPGKGASVALASLSGVPETVADRMKKAFAQEAAQRDIRLAEAKNADYLARAYLNAAPTEAGTAITVVFDVFDADKKRALRFADSLVVEGHSAASDPWSVVDGAAIADVAAKSADALAAFLANAPGAIGKAGTRHMAASRTATAAAGTADVGSAAASKEKAIDLNLAELR
jgi:hypothetical protein